MAESFELADDAVTLALGRRLAAILRAGDFLALHGDLGAGKTTLTRGLIQALLGEDEEVPSPTYTLVQVYEGPDFPIWHTIFIVWKIRMAWRNWAGKIRLRALLWSNGRNGQAGTCRRSGWMCCLKFTVIVAA